MFYQQAKFSANKDRSCCFYYQVLNGCPSTSITVPRTTIFLSVKSLCEALYRTSSIGVWNSISREQQNVTRKISEKLHMLKIGKMKKDLGISNCTILLWLWSLLSFHLHQKLCMIYTFLVYLDITKKCAILVSTKYVKISQLLNKMCLQQCCYFDKLLQACVSQPVGLQDDNKLVEWRCWKSVESTSFVTTCQQTWSKQCEHNLISAFGNNLVESLLQVCHNLCVFTCVDFGFSELTSFSTTHSC